MYDAPECAFHQNQILTNFCLNKECWLPLCPECITIHLEEHRMGRTESNINTLENVRFEILQKVSDISNAYKDLNSRYQQQRKTEITKESKLFDKIDLAKQKVLNTVENYFNSLKTDIREFYSNSKTCRNTSYSTIQNNIEERNREIDTYMHKLTSDNFVKYIVMLHSKQSFQQFDHELTKLNNEIEKSNFSLPEIVLDENAIHGLNIELARYVNFIRRENPFEISGNINYSPPRKNQSYIQNQPSGYFQGTPPRPPFQMPVEIPYNNCFGYRSITPDRVTYLPHTPNLSPVKLINRVQIQPNPIENLVRINQRQFGLENGFITKMASGTPPHHLFGNSNRIPVYQNPRSSSPNIIVEGRLNNSKSINIGEVVKENIRLQKRSQDNMNNSNEQKNQSFDNNTSRLNKTDRVSLVNKSKIEEYSKQNIF